MEKKIYVTVDDDGFPNGFWDMAAYPDDTQIEVPAKAIEITRQQYDDVYLNRASRKLENGRFVAVAVADPVPSVEQYRRAIQSLIDSKAVALQYDSGATLASYVNSTIEQWAAEAQAFVAWRDAVWLYALAELDKVQRGESNQPSVEAFLAELPVFEWSGAQSG
jgi:hypothetical protein